ncbi:MAG: fused MFS/spermidine synthase [Thermoflexales bacterium]|nr:fused MFS/spermidine synthase [Thermoflexales bacterium]
MGTGTLAAYGRMGDVFRFYEINPEVIRLAQGEGAYFSYLADCPAQVEVVPGDARMVLERELAAGETQRFDLLVVDAFSGDSIPVHLLTKEAFDIYLAHLQPDGVIALHISNRYLDVQPVAQRLADQFELGTAFIDTTEDEQLGSHSSWVLVTRDESFLAQPQIARRSVSQAASTASRLWTDDYTNLFQVLKW